jgi:hypothetical protein
MVLIFLGPFALSQLLLPLLSSFNHGLYTLAPVKYKTICPNIYVIKAYSITKIYALKDGFFDIYVIGGLCHSIHAT